MTTATATAAPVSRPGCPRCGARVGSAQDWCLECGAAATTRILRPRGWKLPVAVLASAVAAVVAVLVVNLFGDADRVVATRVKVPAPAAAAAVTPKPAPTAASAASPKRPASAATRASSTAPAQAGAIGAWPSREDAWTVVLATAPSRRAAERRARELIARGVKAGVLDTAKHNVDSGGAAFVVFTGRFAGQSDAVAGEGRLGGRAPASVFVARVSPR